mgnify:CR=1 FL=1
MSKGSDYERELIHEFWKRGWAAFRAAGSGSQQYPCPDLIASNGERVLVIEAKYTKDDRKYIMREERDALRIFAKNYPGNVEERIAVRFKRDTTWYLIPSTDLAETKKHYKVSRDILSEKGKTLRDECPPSTIKEPEDSKVL